MKSFVCVLLGSLLLSAVLAVPNRFSPFAQDVSFVFGWAVDDRKVEFNQTEIGKKPICKSYFIDLNRNRFDFRFKLDLKTEKADYNS